MHVTEDAEPQGLESDRRRYEAIYHADPVGAGSADAVTGDGYVDSGGGDSLWF